MRFISANISKLSNSAHIHSLVPSSSKLVKAVVVGALAFAVTGCSMFGNTCSPGAAPSAQEEQLGDTKRDAGSYKECPYYREHAKSHCKKAGCSQCAECKGGAGCKGCQGCKEGKGCKGCGGKGSCHGQESCKEHCKEHCKDHCKDHCKANNCSKECWKGKAGCGAK